MWERLILFKPASDGFDSCWQSAAVDWELTHQNPLSAVVQLVIGDKAAWSLSIKGVKRLRHSGAEHVMRR